MKQFRPAIVSPLFVAETPFVSNPSSFTLDAETPLFSMIDFFPMPKHHRSALFDFLPILKHQQLFRSSLLLKHLPFTIVRQQDFTLSNVSLNSRLPTQSKTAATTASPQTSMIYGWPNEPNGKAKVCKVYVIQLGYR
jgi:hypothetical protein